MGPGDERAEVSGENRGGSCWVSWGKQKAGDDGEGVGHAGLRIARMEAKLSVGGVRGI